MPEFLKYTLLNPLTCADININLFSVYRIWYSPLTQLMNTVSVTDLKNDEKLRLKTNYAKEHSELGHESHSSCVVTKPSNFHA